MFTAAMAGNRSREHPFDACAYCGEPFEADVSYPVVARETDGGDLELYSFCDASCEAAWHAIPEK